MALGTAADSDGYIALLSRRPRKSAITHTDLEFAYFETKGKVKRGLLEATVATSAGDVTLFSLRLKSRVTVRPDVALRRLGGRARLRPFVALSLNGFRLPRTRAFSSSASATTPSPAMAHEDLRQRGRIEVAVLLPAADAHGDPRPQNYRRDETCTSGDHILVSPGLRGAMNDGTARIFDDESSRPAGDHRPVVATLMLHSNKQGRLLDLP